jgi:hypothetical protein
LILNFEGDTIRPGGSRLPTSRLPDGGVLPACAGRARLRPRRWPAWAWIASASRPTTRSNPSTDHNHALMRPVKDAIEGFTRNGFPPPSKLVKGGFRPGPQEGHEIDHVDPHDLFSGLISHLAIGMKALSPAAKGRLGDIDELTSLHLRKLLLAKPCILSPATKARMWCHTMRLLKLPG